MSEALTGKEFKSQLREGRPKDGIVREFPQSDGCRAIGAQRL